MLRMVVIGLAISWGGWGLRVDAPKYDCLPDGIRPDEVVSYSRNPKDNVTVVRKLSELKARCRKGRLVDSQNKEIRFFRVSCWGNPPPNYLELKQKEKDEIDRLKKSFTVITIGCNPRTP